MLPPSALPHNVLYYPCPKYPQDEKSFFMLSFTPNKNNYSYCNMNRKLLQFRI
ncbi:hypothetical protein BACI348_20054 [Bacillus altitudinis]|uniref:Uncharacterized protein n=1 Tax=Bacillus altitudinis TaxID=293387 RepID=A0A653M2W9_BACAB|nr:hypothetical protein BACI348_20054 [Bacillus altitudinis]